MRYFVKEINVKTPGASDHIATLAAYIPDNSFAGEDRKARPAVLVIPGGGYEHVSARESEPIAMKFASEGLCAFVLEYSIAPAHFPQALCEAFEAMKYIRENAKEWSVNAQKIVVCGFSAGAHLSACVGAFWNKEWLNEYLNVDREMIKPNLMVLSYPVITSGEFAHEGSVKNLLGNNMTKEKLELISLEKQVSKDVPPTFIWHTCEDGSVPVQNTLLFANALVANNIPVEMHVYRRGGHGLSLGTGLVNNQMQPREKHMCSDWVEKAIRFIYDEETK